MNQKNLKNKDFLVYLLSFFTVISFPFLFIFKCDFSENKSQSNIEANIDPELREKNLSGGYNYNSMLNSINKYKNLEKNFCTNFVLFISEKENYSRLNKVFENLKEERQNFKIYLKNIDVYYKKYSWSRKKNSLKYYLRVLEESIKDTKYMMEKFKKT
ncbi:hypothetical protein K9L05_03530 [Candidatus Babeliales bacterium]|nr:hypothetical protein [Candidatus Babeliales bacterium]MCF7899692.1 hypothetical protein [Candidatus Babeliales bacterium]